MRRLVASGLLPERAGQPVKAWVHISLADLLLLDGDSALQEQWTAQVRERWAARRAFASETGSEGGAWLDGDAAEAVACDAAMAPVVTGDVNVDALEDLVRLCVELDRHRRAGGDAAGGPDTPAAAGTTAAADTTAARAALEQAVIGKAVDLLSGPGGLASLLAPPAAGRAAGRAEPAAGHRVFRVGPGRDPQRGDPAGPQVPVGRRLRPARVGVRRAPRQAQEARRQDQRQGLRPVVLFPPPGRDPPAGLDPGPEPRRDHHRAEQGQDEGPAQPRAARPARVRAPARPGPSTPPLPAGSGDPTIAVPDDHRAHKPGPRCRTGPRLGDILSGPPPARDLTNTNRGMTRQKSSRLSTWLPSMTLTTVTPQTIEPVERHTH